MTNDGTAEASTRVYAASLEDEGIFSAVTDAIPELLEIAPLLLLKSTPKETDNIKYLLKETTAIEEQLLEDTVGLAKITLGLEELLLEETDGLTEYEPKVSDKFQEHHSKGDVHKPAAIAAAG